MPAEVCGVNVSFCEWNAWGPTSICDGACGQATTTKRRTLCCNSSNLDDCYQECNISRDGSFEINPCRPCNNGGVYVPALQECQCAEYYNGTCCDDCKFELCKLDIQKEILNTYICCKNCIFVK